MTSVRLPTGGQYQAAVQNPARCFTDPVLRDAVPERTALGLPKPISGNFASVFPMTAASGERYAVKCFTREVPHQLRRYARISARLHALRPRWGTDFVFQPEGVRVDGTAYPILRMDWIEAVSLTRWVDTGVGTPGALRGLADRFDALVGEMAAAGIAHGDLQHGNVLVGPDGGLRVIDYDGMYLPDLAALPSGEVGHPNFQPPGRTPADYGPAMDRFSARLISLSLRALEADPALWDRCNPDHEEYLLLDQTDFADPLASDRLALLLAHPDAQVRELGTYVRDCVPLPLTAMPELAPARPAAEHAAAPEPPAAHLPAWLTGRISGGRGAGTGDTAATGPGEAATGTPGTEAAGNGGDDAGAVTAGRAGTTAAVTWAVRGIVGVALVALVAVAVGIAVASPALAIGGIAVAAGCAGAMYALYRRAGGTGMGGSGDGTRVSGADIGDLERRRDALDLRGKEIVAEFERRRAEARDACDAEVGERVRRRDALAGELAELADARRDDGLRLLARRQAEHVEGRLAGVTLGPRDVDGLSALDIVHLKAAGIARPSDFDGVVYRAGHRAAPGARPVQVPYVQRPDGTEIKVTGIGEAKARRLEWWRNRHLALARRDQPTRLDPDDEAGLDARYAARMTSVRASLTRARAYADDPGPRAELARALGRLDAERRDAERPVTEERVEIGRALQAARAAARTAPGLLAIPLFIRRALGGKPSRP